MRQKQVFFGSGDLLAGRISVGAPTDAFQRAMTGYTRLSEHLSGTGLGSGTDQPQICIPSHFPNDYVS